MEKHSPVDLVTIGLSSFSLVDCLKILKWAARGFIPWVFDQAGTMGEQGKKVKDIEKKNEVMGQRISIRKEEMKTGVQRGIESRGIYVLEVSLRTKNGRLGVID